ncbi:MAG: hypothetical protein C4529_07115 [Deltaproteobacteria bacterium]|nr:MAG: hypothetical protein C4529_07115 [Deltaproteobacteria bacterium]
MRVFLYSLISIPILFADVVLLCSFPAPTIARFTPLQWGQVGGGVLIYFLFHFIVRKPERMYLWAHEFTHLIVAKMFFREVHGFHITSRSGGKVVMDGTNVAIDLAPYAVPLYNAAALVPIALLRGKYEHAEGIYLCGAAFLFTMHLWFSAEGFLNGQPDVRRSGRMFSGAVVLLFLTLWIPFLVAPGTRAGFHGLHQLYRAWMGSGLAVGRELLSRGIALF